MMDFNILARLRAIEGMDKMRAVKSIIESSTPDFDYYLMLVLSTIVATLGLLLDSEATVIGAMLLAPLLAPVLGLSLGLSMSEPSVIARSFAVVLKSSLVAILASLVASFIFTLSGKNAELTDALLSREGANLMHFMVAAISGFAVAYAYVRPKISASLPGVAIAVALIPPLSAVGAGLVMMNFALVSGALLLYLINVAGIVFSAMIAFSLMDLTHKRFLAERLIEKEEERIEKEKEKIEEIKQNNYKQ